MAPNEFFSGRIPKGLLDAIEEHRQNTGESKTQVLINALSTYVNYPLPTSSLPNSPPNSWVDEKFNVLEQRIEALSRLATEIAELKRQIAAVIPQPDNRFDINVDNAVSVANREQLSLLEEGDNKTDNTIDTSDNDNVDNKSDNNVLEFNHAEVAKRTSMAIGSVKNYHSKKKVIEKKGFRYTPKKSGKRAVWEAEELL